MTETPKPTWILVVLSILVIGSSLLIVSFGISVFTATWDPCSLIGGAILIALPAVLTVQQYRGTICRVRSAASTASTLLFIVGVFASLAFVFTLYEMVVVGDLSRWIEALLPISVVMGVGWVGGWLNLRWRRCITSNDHEIGFRFSWRDTLAAFIAICMVTALSSSFIRNMPPQYAEGVSIEEAPFNLPPSASDISYCQGFRGSIAIEFTVEEAPFRQWVAKGIGSAESDASGTKLREIVLPETISRYYWMSDDLNGPESITVKRGLCYSWSFEDRGVHAVFDSTTNRAYYVAHFH